MGFSLQDLQQPGTVYQIGLPPRRIDILTEISGITFPEAWESKVLEDIDGMTIPYLGRSSLVRNKLASGRIKNLADIELLKDR